MLRKRAIASLLKPYTFIKNDPILPKMKNIKSPMNGEKITGNRTGRLVTSRIVENG